MKVPREWIEKALAVPSSPAGRAAGSSQRFRRLAAAAGVVLVLGLSVSLYFVFRNINDGADVVAPYAEATESAPTDITGTVTPTQAEPSGTAPTDAPSQMPTKLSPTLPISTVPPTVRPTEGSSDRPTAAPTEAPQPTAVTEQPTHPSVRPTEPHTEPPTAPYIAPPTVKPTEEPLNNPEDGETSDREAEIFHPLGSDSIFASSENNAIYCRLCDLNGVPIGDPNPYASEHRASVIWQTPDDEDPGSAYLYYAFSGTVDAHPDDALRCIYVFYFRNGYEIARGSITL